MIQTFVLSNQTDYSELQNLSNNYIYSSFQFKRNLNHPSYMSTINEKENIACEMLFNINDNINNNIDNNRADIIKLCNNFDFSKEHKLDYIYEEIYYRIRNSINQISDSKNQYDKLMGMNNDVNFKNMLIINLFILRPIISFIDVIASEMITNIFNLFIQFNILTQIFNFMVNLLLFLMIKRVVGKNLQQITYIKCLEISLSY
jgi:hypothetical protein